MRGGATQMERGTVEQLPDDIGRLVDARALRYTVKAEGLMSEGQLRRAARQQHLGESAGRGAEGRGLGRALGGGAGRGTAGRRPADGSQNPGESIEFARMIHRIHSGEELTQDYTIYGFGGAIDTDAVDIPGAAAQIVALLKRRESV